jgi:hypothetical protein
MHTLIGMIRSQTYWDTAEFVNDVNRRLCKSSIVAGDQGGFITLLYCSLDLEKHVPAMDERRASDTAAARI